MGGSTNKPVPKKPARRRGVKSETRKRLVQAALDLLRTGGEQAVSTVSVTRGAGIVQSAFYQHFSNVDECIEIAAEQVAQHIRKSIADARHDMYAKPFGTANAIEQFNQTLFKLAAETRPMMELFLRYHMDRMAMGGVMYKLARDLSIDLANDLLLQAKKAGLGDLPEDWVQATADHLVAANLSAVQARFEKRGLDAEASSRLLAWFSTGACVGVLEALRKDEKQDPAVVLFSKLSP